jgi:hypothetical protein
MSNFAGNQQAVFIDSRIPDLQDLVEGVDPGTQVFVLDPASDGIEQIADILASNHLTNLNSIAILSHGDSGELELGSSFIADGDLVGHASALAEIGSALAPDGTIQLFGCDVALGANGQQFINDFSMFAGGAIVEAASHAVGAATLGGSWTLDASSNGAVPADGTPFTPAALAQFDATLATTVQTEIWISVDGGGPATELMHVDDTGAATPTNTTVLWSPSSANRPTSVSQLVNVAIDPTNETYFLAHANASNDANIIWKGSLLSEINNPTGTPSLTAVYSVAGTVNGTAGTGFITGLELDSANQQVYFTQRHDIRKVSYNGGTVTTLATGGSNVFADGLALDLPHNQAFFFSNTTFSTFDSHSNIVTSVSSNAVYADLDLSLANSTPTHLKLLPADTHIAGGGDFPVTLGLITGIAVDTVTEKLYFVTAPVLDPTKSPTKGTGGVYEYDLSQGTQGTYTALWVEPSSGDAFSYIDVDHATGVYYLSDIQSGSEAVYRGSLSGGAPTLFTTVAPSTVEMVPQGLAIDNAPTLSVTSANPTFTESVNNPASTNNTPVSLVSSATATDSDNTNLVSATVSIGSFFTGDQLTFSTTGTSISGNYNGATGVLTLSGVDSLAHYQTVLNSVDFTSTSDNPTNYGNDTSRTITFTVSDGLLSSAAQTSMVTVVATDDPPVNHLPGTAPSGNEDTTFSITGLSITDVDADPANQNITVALSVSHGKLTLSTGIANGVTSGEVTGNNSSSLSITATQNQIDATLANANGLQYLGNANFNTGFAAENLHIVTSDLGNTGSGGPQTATSDLSITVTAVNDPPNLQPHTTSALSYTENAAVTALFAGEAIDTPVADPDNPANYSGGSLTVGITSGFVTGDQIVLLASSPFTISGGTLMDGATAIGTISGNATQTVTVSSLTAAATPAEVDKLLVAFGYQSTSDDPGSGDRTVTETFNDGGNTGSGGAKSDSITQTVHVTAVNDSPVNHVPGAQTVNEDTALIFNGGNVNLISITDPDAESGNETVTLSVNHGTLTLGSTAGLGFDSGTNGTGNFTFHGTLANVNVALTGLTYQGNPNFNGSDTLTITTNDNGNTPPPPLQDQDTVANDRECLPHRDAEQRQRRCEPQQSGRSLKPVHGRRHRRRVTWPRSSFPAATATAAHRWSIRPRSAACSRSSPRRMREGFRREPKEISRHVPRTAAPCGCASTFVTTQSTGYIFVKTRSTRGLPHTLPRSGAIRTRH